MTLKGSGLGAGPQSGCRGRKQASKASFLNVPKPRCEMKGARRRCRGCGAHCCKREVKARCKKHFKGKAKSIQGLPGIMTVVSANVCREFCPLPHRGLLIFTTALLPDHGW